MNAVSAGEYDIHSNEKSELLFSVERIVVHPEWNGDIENGYDYPKNSFCSNLIFYHENEYVAIAERPTDDQMLPHSFTCYITSWGTTDCEL